MSSSADQDHPPMTDIPPFDRWRLDELLDPKDMLWGLKAIANARGGVSVDTVRRLAKSSSAPISRPAGRYFASRRELNAWLRAK